VYRKIGGHAFPWVYSGPIGAIITPQFLGVTHEPGLPFASSLCGACAEVCPVKIDIPKILLDLRSEVKKAEAREGGSRLERWAFRAWAWLMRHPKLYEMAGMMAAAMAPAPESGRWIRTAPGLLNLPPVRAWLSQRDLPPPPAKSFRQMWRAR
jgi:L-lactate dehydrogenase complex protein LldF